jgi:apolipoprotein N-acyltransferase
MQPVILIELATAAGLIAIALFLPFAAAAYLLFRLMRKGLKIALRLIVVALVLFAGIAFSLSYIYFYGGKKPEEKRPPAATRTR